MTLPPLPQDTEGGWDWIGKLTGGWYVVPVWGSYGWYVGEWPFMILAHYDGRAHRNPSVYGMAVYIDGHVEVSRYSYKALRDRATNRFCVQFWAEDRLSDAPKTENDRRLGAYLPQ